MCLGLTQAAGNKFGGAGRSVLCVKMCEFDWL